MDKILVLFDFDGTITTRDTFMELIKYQKGKTRFYLGMYLMVPYITLFKAGILKAQTLKEKVMSHFWKGMNADDFAYSCMQFNKKILPKLLRDKAIEQLKLHIKNGDEVAVVSASAEEWVKPFCESYHIKCICTVMDKKDGKITGKLSGNNCNSEEKVRRIKEAFVVENYTSIIAYGDSKGDKAMLKLSTSPNFKPFRN